MLESCRHSLGDGFCFSDISLNGVYNKLSFRLQLSKNFKLLESYFTIKGEFVMHSLKCKIDFGRLNYLHLSQL